jgi:membrane-associated protease RseP (regulator of RpoE activity)
MKGIMQLFTNGLGTVFCLAALPLVTQQAARPWLGFGLSCSQCQWIETAGVGAWTFRSPPVVAEVSPGGPAARAGMRVGDTLTALDGVSFLTEEAGRRFARLEPGQRIRLSFRHGREGAATLVVARQPSGEGAKGEGPVQFSGTVGGNEIEVRGEGAMVTSDEGTGTLEIRGKNIVVRVRQALPRERK